MITRVRVVLILQNAYENKAGVDSNKRQEKKIDACLFVTALFMNLFYNVKSNDSFRLERYKIFVGVCFGNIL
jgi:hypothetical protein